MGNTVALANKKASDPDKDWAKADFLTLTIADQMFGIPVLQVQDILGQQVITPIPLAPQEVAGALNLRGRIVTAIDVRKRLGLGKSKKDSAKMSVVVEYTNELYSLMIDEVGDVLSLSDKNFEQNPTTLDPLLREVSSGIYRLEGRLLVVLDIPKLLDSVDQSEE